MIYPNSATEFRVLVKKDGIQELQVRYVCEAQGYKSKWQPINVEYENDNSST